MKFIIHLVLGVILWVLASIICYIVISVVSSSYADVHQLISTTLAFVPLYDDKVKFIALIAGTSFVVLVGVTELFLSGFNALFGQETPQPRRHEVTRVPQQTVLITPPPVRQSAQPTPVSTPPVTRAKPSKPPLEITSFRLIVNKGGQFKVTKGSLHANEALRPVIALKVNNESWLGKGLPLQFDLVSPSGKTVQRIAMRPILKSGVNYITPDNMEFRISKKVKGMRWMIRLWAGSNEWCTLLFTVTNESIESLSRHIGHDMEMDEHTLELANQIASTFTIDDLLSSLQ